MTVEERIDYRRASIVSQLIRDRLVDAAEGHCVRIDYLDREEALAVCSSLRSYTNTKLTSFVLGTSSADRLEPCETTADRAIELRNRKQGVFCLLVPPDIVDAAISSLGNSFAQLDGRELHKLALERVCAQLSDGMQGTIREVREQLGGSSRASTIAGRKKRANDLAANCCRLTCGRPRASRS